MQAVKSVGVSGVNPNFFYIFHKNKMFDGNFRTIDSYHTYKLTKCVLIFQTFFSYIQNHKLKFNTLFFVIMKSLTC